MEIEVQKFLETHHRGVLVAQKKNGRPHITLVTPGIDDQGRLIVTSRGTTVKVKNLRRDPRVSLLVMGEQFSGSKYVQIEGDGGGYPIARSHGSLDRLAPPRER